MTVTPQTNTSTPVHKSDPEVVATYNDGEVTTSELQKFIDTLVFMNTSQAPNKDVPEFREFILKQLVMTKIINERASDQSKSGAEVKVKQQMDPIMLMDEQDREEMTKRLKAINLDLTDIEQYFRLTFTTVEEMSSKVTDQQVRDEYDTMIEADASIFATASISHILIGLKDPSDPTGQKALRTEEEALQRVQEVQEKLDNGDDFALLAKEYSDDSGSKDRGGTYEDVDVAQFVPEFAKAALELPLNTISDPIATEYGYHIMKVASRSEKTFDDVKSSIRSKLANDLINEFMLKEYPSYNYKSNLPT
ncbi:peptidylprolyl isomerase [Cohnella sp.]|uniref:peptidylprolyl isomerase n=1 Tax=Cohnella sp. TaxID=1883426 RepID=UPI0035684A7A